MFHTILSLFGLVGESKCTFISFSSPKNVEKTDYKPQVIDRTKAVTQHFLEKSFKKLLKEKL